MARGKLITIELRPSARTKLLDISDIFNYVSDTTKEEVEFITYIDKWCSLLNHLVTTNGELRFGDIERANLQSWITGYNFAKHINTEETVDYVRFKYGNYKVTLYKPLTYYKNNK